MWKVSQPDLKDISPRDRSLNKNGLKSPETQSARRNLPKKPVPHPPSPVCASHSLHSSSVSSQLFFLRLLISHTPVVLGRVDVRIGKARRRSLCPV